MGPGGQWRGNALRERVLATGSARGEGRRAGPSGGAGKKWAARERSGPEGEGSRGLKRGGSGSGRAQVCAAGLCEGVGGGLGRGEERERVGRRVGLAGVW